MYIDSHQHFWQYDPTRHHWMDDAMAVLRRDFLPGELQELFSEHSIDGCVAVQVDQTPAENDFLLKLASEYPFILGIVGWADFRDLQVEANLERYSENKGIKGFRHIVQSEPDPNFLLRPTFTKGIACLEQFGFTYDILVFPHQLGAVLEFVKRFPNQKFVIDHLAKPYIKDRFYEGWATLIQAIGKHENVFCKLSGMITEADSGAWKPEDLHPYMDQVLVTFGAERLMYGSDWPVCLLAGNYRQVVRIVHDFIAPLSRAEQSSIMGGNALAFYNLKSG